MTVKSAANSNTVEAAPIPPPPPLPDIRPATVVTIPRVARPQDDDGAPTEVTIRMNQTDLAQLAGTSRESVSRFLAELERAGVVRSGRGRVTVLEPQKLRNYIY